MTQAVSSAGAHDRRSPGWRSSLPADLKPLGSSGRSYHARLEDGTALAIKRVPVDSAEDLANDALLYSSDGGATWKELLRQNAKLLGFALSPDGTAILAGYGDPVESGYYVDSTVTGAYLAGRSALMQVAVL